LWTWLPGAWAWSPTRDTPGEAPNYRPTRDTPGEAPNYNGGVVVVAYT